VTEQNGRALAVRAPSSLAPIEWNQPQIDLLKRTLAAARTQLANDELALFIAVCKRTQLDPFLKQIYAIKDKSGRLIIHVGIDGRRSVAQRTGQVNGTDGPYWCGADGVWRDVWLSGDNPAAAKFTVYRKGHANGYTAVARWASFKGASSNWTDRPDHQLAKVAEDHAFRRAFPYEMAGMPAYQPEHDQDPDPDEALEAAAQDWGRMRPPPGVPDALGAYAAAAPIAERQASGRRARPAPRPRAEPVREMTGDPVVDHFRGDDPPPDDAIDGESRELVDDEEPTAPRPPEVREICRELMDKIRRLNPGTKIQLPPDDAPDIDWSSWHDEWLPKVEAEETRRTAQTAK